MKALRDIFHKCQCTGQQFTLNEWCEYCSSHPSSEVVFTFKEYGFNINDCCVSDRNVVDWKNKYCHINISVAQSPCGRWSFGHRFEAYTAGSTSSAKFVSDGEGYSRENQAICAALDSAEKFIKSEIEYHSLCLNKVYDDENGTQKAFSALPYLMAGLEEIAKLKSRHVPRQLSLFDFL